MSKYSALIKRASNATAALALTMASLTPAVMLGGTAKAAQLQSRSVEMSSSLADANGVTYAATFTPVSNFDTSVLIEICDSPLFDVACTTPGGATASQSVTTTGTAGTPKTVNFTIDNPTAVTTFYARITTRDVGPVTVDTGSVALMTTLDVTINARVQEQLTFCVGADTTANITSRTDCATGSWTQTVDLGVISTSQASPVPTASPDLGNNKTGFFVLRTNAVNGARVAYDPSTELKVAGETCTAGNASTSDMCFNNASALAIGSLAGGTEKFGMSINSIDRRGNSEGVSGARLTAESDYNDKYTWDMTAGLHTIATASDPVDWDVARVDFGASTASSTPSGSYTTSANFVATGLF